MADAVIKIENAVVSYREDVALRGVSIEIYPGEFVGVIGPNGAGKTTLLTIVNGLGKLVSGKVRVLGNPVSSGNGHSLRKKVGYVAQLENIDPRMPMHVREVAMIGRYGVLGLFKRPGRDDWKIVDEMLELVGMSHLADRPIGHLSGGEQQRVAIARALVNNPAVLLCDEVTGNLDSGTGDDIMQLLRTLNREEGKTFVLITHDPVVAQSTDRLVTLHDGEIIGEKRVW